LDIICAHTRPKRKTNKLHVTRCRVDDGLCAQLYDWSHGCGK
jgi:hypothetical protein